METSADVAEQMINKEKRKEEDHVEERKGR